MWVHVLWIDLNFSWSEKFIAFLLFLSIAPFFKIVIGMLSPHLPKCRLLTYGV